MVHKEMEAHQEAEHQILKKILHFSELIKKTKDYYKYALDREKQEISYEIFSELTLYNGELIIKAKEGFEALFTRHSAKCGGPGRI
ncbi:MAG: hypothetical protein U9R06_00200 [Patescibacteria group bacterium]|nr:hypothetical protein [Patescibacteria group bacterium]